ncbi:hypothetical protein ACFU76_04645 [Streptomyces sp. NPDC057539]|uniref:hypothetical protein n=1 Tax=Streptomyces sp. NPDC057539 TaxID=3346159 RepID=UPI0036C173F1
MSSSGVTTADLYRWQRRGHEALGVMLEHGATAGLAPLTWTIASSGALTGEAGSLMATPAEQRAAIEAWAGFLDARVEERVDGEVAHLYAAFSRDGGVVVGAIRATIFPDLAEGGE